jgi:hypothetical protein
MSEGEDRDWRVTDGESERRDTAGAFGNCTAVDQRDRDVVGRGSAVGRCIYISYIEDTAEKNKK